MRDNRWPKHEKAIEVLNRLFIDLKLQFLGYAPHEVVTVDRLSEVEKVVFPDIERCTEPLVKYAEVGGWPPSAA